MRSRASAADSRNGYPETVLREIGLKQLADAAVVVDHQYVRPGHPRVPAPARTALSIQSRTLSRFSGLTR